MRLACLKTPLAVDEAAEEYKSHHPNAGEQEVSMRLA